MEKNRTILAIALIILVWSGYNILFPPQPPPASAPQQVVVEETSSSNKSANSEFKNISTSSPEETFTIKKQLVEKNIVVESDIYLFKLTTSGARINQAKLKKYRKSNEPDSDFVDIVSAESNYLATFRTTGKEGLGLPSDLDYTLQNDNEIFILKNKDTQIITFVGKTSGGLEIHKKYTFYADSYEFDLNVKLINRSGQPTGGVFDLSLVNFWDDSRKGDSYNFVGPTTLIGEEIKEDDPEDLLTSSKSYNNDFHWSGFFTKYFASIVSPEGDSAKRIQVQMGDGYVENIFSSAPVKLETNEVATFNYIAYLGPKDYDILKASGNRFDYAIDLGFFSIIAQPLLVGLKFFYGYLGNWGFAIVLLTICIKALFWPLTQKSYSSMKAMQKLQPQMAKMREKYSSDKQRLNQEMMALYKENRVNPLGGCLPMLIQIPVFFALYQLLLHSIELRHAPFMLWITDLSAKDPYYVTPLIMGATMFIQQKMSPTTMEPMQAKMMMMMPVVFTFLFLNFPSGLVVYWLVNNVLTIAQQYLINRKPT